MSEGEGCICCNVMLNSNMQCSHHGNGGSSEASHGAETGCLCVFACNVRARVCVCERACLQARVYVCAFVQRSSRKFRENPSGGEALGEREGAQHRSESEMFRISLKWE